MVEEKQEERRHLGHGTVAILVSVAVSGLIVKLIGVGGESLWTLAGLAAVFLVIVIVVALRGQTSKDA